jgi:hypothetical protein
MIHTVAGSVLISRAAKATTRGTAPRAGFLSELKLRPPEPFVECRIN